MSLWFTDCTSLCRGILLSLLFVNGVLLLPLIWLEAGNRRRRLWMIPDTVCFAVVFFLLTELTIQVAKLKKNLPLPEGAVQIPAVLLLGYALLLFVRAVLGLRAEIAERRRHPGPGSIRQAVNTLPDGICFFTPEGRIKLCNYQMYRLCQELLGRDLQNYEELAKAVAECPAAEEQNGGVVRLPGTEVLLKYPDGQVWRYHTARAETGDITYTEAVLSNVTELYQRQEELKSQSERLKEMSRELKRLSQQVQVMTREREILTAKTRLHDEMGEGLTAIRQAVLKKLPPEEAQSAVSMLKRAVLFLSLDNAAEGAAAADTTEAGDSAGSIYTEMQREYRDFVRDAETIGIRVELEDRIPAETKAAAVDRKAGEDIFRIFMLAVREALTNCARHADASVLKVTVKPEEHMPQDASEAEIIFEMTNDGRPPAGPVVPGGGLVNVRAHVENAGGRVEIESAPAFLLRIRLPLKAEQSSVNSYSYSAPES